MSLEQYIKDNLPGFTYGADYRLVIKSMEDGILSFYMHPLNRSGQTIDGLITRNHVTILDTTGEPHKP
jgi:hypothetical protein